LPSTSGKTLGTAGNDFTQLSLVLSDQANAYGTNVGVQSGTVQFWGIQLEVAQAGQTQPTPLEKLDPRYDLDNARRFYRSITISQRMYAGAAGAHLSVTFAMSQMRATPTATALSGGTATNIASATLTPVNNNVDMVYDIAATAAGDTVASNVIYGLSADL
jgi:hypothetical protein